MAKLTEANFNIKGQSGTLYSFGMYEVDTDFKAKGGIYIFTKRYKNNKNEYTHNLIYCGKAADLSTRFNNHHQEKCIEENNANCHCIMLIESEKERTEIEIDILKGNNFSCNIQNN